jgi:hypothetical protein
MSSTEKHTEAPHKAGAFDIRAFIALLIGIYGVVLVIAGLIGPSQADLEKADGLNINLLAGIGMVVVSAAFLIWARLRPVVVPEHAEHAEDRPHAGH